MDIYIKPISSNEYILLLLKEKLNHNIDLCKLILDIKNKNENKDTLEYHVNRWETVIGEYYYTKDTHHGKFSYIFDNIKYIIKPDHRLNFYKITGISYQIIELIHELIHIRNENSWDFEIDDKDDWIKYDDKLYKKLADKIMIEMKKITM